MPGVSPGQMAFPRRLRLACVFDLASPAGFEPAHTAPECTPAYSRYPAETQPDWLAWGAYGPRESSSSDSPFAAIDSHDPEGHTLH
jgi:hypothetical protein